MVARDYGFAPNPFFGYCTLATCKPGIRASGRIGDWIAGLSAAGDRPSPGLVYVMQIAEVLAYDAYWRDTRFANKRPDLRGSTKRAFGDNIYHRPAANAAWRQADSHHSLEDGSPNPRNVNNDTKSQNVLVATRYAYWGRSSPDVPTHFRDFEGHDLVVGRGHKNSFPPVFVEAFGVWFESLNVQGCLGAPFRW